MPNFDDLFADLPDAQPVFKAGEADSLFADAPMAPMPQQEPPRETTWGEFGTGMGLDLAQGLMRAPKALVDMAAQGERAMGSVPGMASPYKPVQAASDWFQRGIDSAEALKPDAYKKEAKHGFVEYDKEGNMVGLQVPSAEAFLGTTVQSLPQIPQFLAGGGASGMWSERESSGCCLA